MNYSIKFNFFNHPKKYMVKDNRMLVPAKNILIYSDSLDWFGFKPLCRFEFQSMAYLTTNTIPRATQPKHSRWC